MDERRQTIDRRAALGGLLAGAAGLGGLVRPGWAQVPAPAPVAKAKSVIQMWLWGGPCHLDTWDPKPEAGVDYCGQFANPIETNVAGIRVCEMLPELAKHGDKLALLRSVTHGNNGHETAAYITQTGREPGGRLVYPSVGAVVSRFKGYDVGYGSLIPPYIVLTTPQGRFDEAGLLGPKYKPFATGGDPNARVFTVEGIVLEGVTPERQERRRELLHLLDTLGRQIPGDPRFEALDHCEDGAYDLILGDGGKVFDLTQESDETRERYGRNRFGQSCLMARRLVELGVPYITINYQGWDTHKQHFQLMRRMLPEMDRGFAALLTDLAERGLLDSTIVWWGGEFGRTPKVQTEAPWNGGRGHWGQVFSMALAGGGLRGGQVVGASDATGSDVLERPISPREVIATIYHQLGIDANGPLPNPSGLDLKVCEPVQGPGIIGELV